MLSSFQIYKDTSMVREKTMKIIKNPKIKLGIFKNFKVLVRK